MQLLPPVHAVFYEGHFFAPTHVPRLRDTIAPANPLVRYPGTNQDL